MKFESRLVLVGLLLVAVMLVGCVGGGGSSATNEAQIHVVLDRYETAMVNGDAEGLANLMIFPLTIDGETISTKEEAIFIYSFAFGMMDIHEFKIKDREIIVSSSGTTATIAGIAHSKISTFMGVETDSQPITLQFKKVGSQWKISGGE